MRLPLLLLVLAAAVAGSGCTLTRGYHRPTHCSDCACGTCGCGPQGDCGCAGGMGCHQCGGRHGLVTHGCEKGCDGRRGLLESLWLGYCCGGHGGGGHEHHEVYTGDPGMYGPGGGPYGPAMGGYGAYPPSAAAVAYPYYTVRGPRDFLAREPGSIGP